MLRSLVNTQIDVCTRPVYNLNIFVSVLLGAPIGVVVALFESRRAAGARTIAEIVMRILEVIQAFPVFVFAVVLVTVFGGSTANIIAAVAFTDAPQQLRTETHLRIGRLLLAHTRPKKRTIFEIVNQINRGAALITSRDEREQIAELNLVAGKRAKASTAYTSALNYLIVGAALLADDSWERRHGLAFELELHRAECEFLTGQSAAAEERLTMLSSRAANTVELATVACLREDLYTSLDQSDRAVDVCLAYLRHLGVEWSPHPTEEEGRREYERIWSQLGSREILKQFWPTGQV